MKKSDPLQQYRALRSALSLERDAIQKRLQELNAALGDTKPPITASPVAKKRGRPPGKAKAAENITLSPKPAKNKMSAAGLANIKAAQKARWAKVKAGAPAAPKTEAAKVETAKPARKKSKISAAGLANIKAAQKARWAKINATKAKK